MNLGARIDRLQLTGRRIKDCSSKLEAPKANPQLSRGLTELGRYLTTSPLRYELLDTKPKQP